MAYEQATSWRDLEPGQCALCGQKHPRHVVLTLREFCERYRMPRQAYYTLEDKPAVMRIGGRIRIALEDALEWEKRRKVV